MLIYGVFSSFPIQASLAKLSQASLSLVLANQGELVWLHVPSKPD
jgi:hypothetical protein